MELSSIWGAFRGVFQNGGEFSVTPALACGASVASPAGASNAGDAEHLAMRSIAGIRAISWQAGCFVAPFGGFSQ